MSYSGKYSGQIILPIGDSLTNGNTVVNNYRYHAFKRAIDNEVGVLEFRGSTTQGTATTYRDYSFPRTHSGTPGATLANINTAIAADMVSVAPRIVLLQGGDNSGTSLIDVNDLSTVTTYIVTPMSTCLDTIFAADPTVSVGLSNIAPAVSDNVSSITNAQVQAANTGIRNLVASRADSRITLIDTYSYMTDVADWEDRYFDSDIHPNSTGYAQMALSYYEYLVHGPKYTRRDPYRIPKAVRRSPITLA